MSEKTKQILGVEVTFQEQNCLGKPVFYIEARILERKRGEKGDEWRYIYSQYCEKGESYVEGLYTKGRSYADHPEYGIKGVSTDAPHFQGELTLGDMEKALATLRKVEKGMNKLAATAGRPESFGAYVCHFAQALGAECILMKAEPEWKEITGQNFREYKPADAIYHINSKIGEWQKANFPLHAQKQETQEAA